MRYFMAFFALTIAALELLPHAIALAAVLGILAAALLLKKGSDTNDRE